MASIEKIIQNIKEVLADMESSSELDVSVVSHLANEYEDHFLQMAEKANRCLELLHEGSQREASKLAKQDPDLRDQFNCIDFDERLQWIKLCENFQVPCDNASTENINACAGIIERVYKTKDNLTELLRIHRRLALKRAPLSERLRVLRLIAQEDAVNAVWVEDIRGYEKEYLDELGKLAKEAVRQHDLETLEDISKEVHSEDWRTRVPEKFIKTVDRYVLANRQRYANKQLKKIIEKIHQAHAAMDEQTCRGYYDQWNQVLGEFDVEPSPELDGQIQPAIEWLTELSDARDQDKAFTDACAKLEHLIDEKSTSDDLEKQAAKILSFEQGMPELLAARFTSKMDSLKLKRKRIFTIAVAAVVGILLMIAAGMTVAFIRLDEGRQLERWQRQIASALKNDSLESAGKLLSKLGDEAPEIFIAPEIQQLNGEYQKKYELEEKRKRDLEDILASFKERGVETITPAMLERAEKKAQGSDKELEVLQWRTKVEDLVRAQQQQRDQAFESHLKQLNNEYSKYQAMEPLERYQFRAEVGELQDQAKALAGSENISTGPLSRARILHENIRSDLRKSHDEATRKEGVEKALSRLARSYQNTTELSKDLQGFVDNFGDRELTDDFLNALDFKKEWAAVDAWNGLVQSWGANLLTGDSSVIRQRLGQLDSYLKNYPSSPCRQQITAYQDYLNLAEVKLKSLNTEALSRLIGVLQSPLMSELLMVKSSHGDNYYMLENTFMDFQEDKLKFKYVSDSTLNEKSEYLSKNNIDPKGLKPSPQSAFSKKALKKLSDIKSDGWETGLLELALECAQDKEMDCILRANLIKLFLQSAQNVVPYEAEQVEAILDDIDEDKIDVNWIDPANQKANQIRPDIEEFLKTVCASVEKTTREIKTQLSATQGSINMLQFAGIVLGEENNVIVHSKQTPRNGQAVVIRKLPNKEISFLEIGKIADYKFLGSAKNIPQGTPVFVRPD